MGRKERDYDTILSGLQGIRKTLSDLYNNAKRLNTEGSAAESELKDRVGQKDIQTIKELSETIIKAVNPGEERVLELEREIQAEKSRFEELER